MEIIYLQIGRISDALNILIIFLVNKAGANTRCTEKKRRMEEHGFDEKFREKKMEFKDALRQFKDEDYD
jgi:hypothetical protein